MGGVRAAAAVAAVVAGGRARGWRRSPSTSSCCRACAANLYRPGERERGVHGIICYPLAVLLLLVAFPRRPDIVAAAWGILAIGDGMATLVGRAIGGPRWPWNREKTLSGSAAFAIGGAAAGVFLAWWCRPAVAPPPALAFTIAAPIARGGRGRARRNDPGPARRQPLGRRRPPAPCCGWRRWRRSTQLPAGDGAGGRRGCRRRSRSTRWSRGPATARGPCRRPGAVAGAIIGITIFAGLGWQGWVLLLVTFVAASVASRLGLRAQDAARHRRRARRTARRRATRSPTPAWRRSPRCWRSPGTSDDAGAARVRRGARRRRQRYDRERNRQGVGTADVVDHVAGARAAGHVGRDVARRHRRRRRRRARRSALAAVALGLAPLALAARRS